MCVGEFDLNCKIFFSTASSNLSKSGQSNRIFVPILNYFLLKIEFSRIRKRKQPRIFRLLRRLPQMTSALITFSPLLSYLPTSPPPIILHTNHIICHVSSRTITSLTTALFPMMSFVDKPQDVWLSKEKRTLTESHVTTNTLFFFRHFLCDYLHITLFTLT